MGLALLLFGGSDPDKILALSNQRCGLIFQAGVAGQGFSAGIFTGRDNLAVEQQQGQAIRAAGVKSSLYSYVAVKNSYVLRQVVSFDVDTFALEPVEVGGKAGQFRVDAGAADPSGTTHCRIEYLQLLHTLLFASSVTSRSAFHYVHALTRIDIY